VEPRWDVDFVVGEDEPAEELLPEPAARPPYRSPVLLLVVVAALAFAVVAGLRLAERHPHRPAALPLVRPPLVTLPHLRTRVLQPVPDLREAAADVVPSGLRFCPAAGDGGSTCSITRHLPASVRAALQAHLPAARHIEGFDEHVRDTGYGGNGLWYRQLRARFGSGTLTITVARRAIPQPEEAMKLPQYVGFSFHHGGLYVRTVVHLGRPRIVPILRLMALTRDPRLRHVA
jgi:hypothetical protein